jgi:hypothetical protein
MRESLTDFRQLPGSERMDRGDGAREDDYYSALLLFIPHFITLGVRFSIF